MEHIMGPDTFVPFLFFGFLTAVIVVPIMAKEATKRSAHQLVSQAIARGQELDPELLQRLSQETFYDANRARRSLGNGVILLALAGGFVAAGYAADAQGWGDGAHHGMLIPAIIMGAVGAAFLILATFDYMTKKREA
jgi:hypothetical protein